MSDIDATAWNELLERQAQATPFMRHEFFAALEHSGSATTARGWQAHFVLMFNPAGELQAACPLYFKANSRGEYVFDWSWADAYQRHGLAYYPKAVIAVPFTPTPGSRLLAVNEQARAALIDEVLAQCQSAGASSLHVLFGHAHDMAACTQAGLMLRHTVQFHWNHRASMPEGGAHHDFESFLSALNQDKRKKIRQERRKVREAGVRMRHARGRAITNDDWDFFYRCYERTYLEHGNPPYLSRAFFAEITRTLPENWLLFIAERDGRPIASSLIALREQNGEKAAWGRYWGALERVDCLHFEACYYSPLQWCIEHGFQRFEGGAQGEHKLARALLPVRTDSAHWLAHPQFAQAVQEFLVREQHGVNDYLDELDRHTPFRQSD